MPQISVRISIRTYPNRQGSCKTAKRFASRRIGGARQRTTHHSPTQQRGPGTAAPGSTRPSQPTTDSAHTQSSGPAPLQLQAVFSNGGRVNSACEQAMAQTTLSVVSSKHTGRESRAGFEWRGTFGHHGVQAAPNRWSAPSCCASFLSCRAYARSEAFGNTCQQSSSCQSTAPGHRHGGH